MIELLIVVLVAVVALSTALFLLGFRLGGDQWQSELAKVRLEAARAERQLHDVTRSAFVSMAEAAERRRKQS